MILPDANALVYAHVKGAERHEEWRAWWEQVVSSESPFAVADVCLTGFVRVVTHPRVLTHPLGVQQALERVEAVLARPNCTVVRATSVTWGVFTELCTAAGARGNTVPDAWIAALAITHGCHLATADRGFGRWPGLTWSDPVAG